MFAMKKTFQILSSILVILFLSTSFNSLNQVKAFEKADNLSSYLSISDQSDGKQAFQYMEKLCSKEFEGRQTGTKGGQKSSEWISEMFQGFGLKPGNISEKNYFQTYKAPVFNLLPEISFGLTTKSGDITFQYKKDYIPSPGTGKGFASGAILFVGYGITNTELSYDDYASVDVKNKIVLILRKGPSFIKFPESDLYFTTKVANAKKHGAIGIVISEKYDEENPYPINSKPSTGLAEGDMPSVLVPSEVADRILLDTNITIETLQKEIDVKKSPQSISIKAGVYIKVNMSIETKDTNNVIGYIPAEDPDSKESILITAHYDHLGVDLVNGDLYPGANDNASGVSALIESARVLRSNCFIPKINIVFIAFSGEEEGLLGSSFYIKNPIFPLDKILAVLNMDMVGTGTGPIYAGTSFDELTEMINKASSSLKLKVPISKNLMFGGSDQYLFAEKNIPAVFFIRSNPTGIGDYHSPEDTPETVDPSNLEEQVKLITLIVSGYSKPDFLIFDTKSDSWFSQPSLHERILLKGKGTIGLSCKIQDTTLRVPENGIIEKLIFLKGGQNLITIQIFDKNHTIIFERILIIEASPIKELVADLNFDQQVDIQDLSLFSKQFEKDQVNFGYEELCDFNNDKKIDSKDFEILKNVYGYILDK